jgi:predicted dinucleotide-binding enzyme
MNVSIIGAGTMAHGIGARFATINHELTIYDRTAEKAKALAEKLGSHVKSHELNETLTGDIIVLALPYAASLEIAEKYKEQLAGKIVVDISNPVDFTTFELIPPAGSSGVEEIAKTLPESTKLIKAFNTTFAQGLIDGVVNGKKIVVQMAANDAEAKNTLKSIIEESGIEASDIGTIEKARDLEKTAQANIKAMYATK